MIEPPAREDDPARDPAREVAQTRTLALLHAQSDAVRADLASLRRDLAQVKEELSGLRTAQLLEVNEELVQAAVHADTAAQTAVSSLGELTRSTQHDQLTGAANRALMLDRLEGAVAMAQRRSTRVGVIFVDLDYFKQINDSLGHAVGDLVLQMATRRLEAAVRDSDSVSRHGGDEFVVLLAEMTRPADAAAVAQKILESLAAPALVGPHTLSLSASLGISVYPDDGADAIALINRADAAMYRAKRRGPGNFEFCAGDGSGADADAAPVVAAPPGRRPDSALAEHEARLRELLDANKHLVTAAQTAQKLQAAAEDAHQRQINFVAMAAHALRSPLSAIRMASATISRPRIDEQTRATQHTVIQRQSAHMARLIGDLLDGSRIGTGEFRLQRGKLELGVILAQAIDACRHAIDAKAQQLHVALAPAPCLVDGDPQRLVQVFGNLLDNGSRRSPRGGELTLSVAADGHEWLVTVADNGVGIAPEALPHVFDLFSLDTSVPLDESGLGIGLAVVDELVKAHGGSVAATSAGPEQGSEFIVRLPAASAGR